MVKFLDNPQQAKDEPADRWYTLPLLATSWALMVLALGMSFGLMWFVAEWTKRVLERWLY